MHGVIGDLSATKSIKELLSKIDGKSPLKDSLFEQASDFFLHDEKDKKTLADLHSKLDELTQSAQASTKKTDEDIQQSLKQAKQAFKREKERQEDKREMRLQNVLNVCEKLIRLSEGESWEATQTASARVLGTLQLLCPNEGANVQQEKQRYKPAYKAVLAVRLTDKLLTNEKIPLQYLRSCYDPNKRYYLNDKKTLTEFHVDVVIPLMIAAIFQDVGLLHPQSQHILKGPDGKRDQYEVLDKDSRIKLLKLNRTYTLEYVISGLGTQRYVGDSKPEREAFNARQLRKIKLIKNLLVGAQQPKEGMGNLIKIPQIYTSFIFSTKPQQSMLDLPKAGLLITNAAKKGAVSTLAVDSLLQILGHFPQGYGVTYITKYSDGSFSDSFEYAIVIGLNPKNPFEPICRTATKQLAFIPSGQILAISTQRNLYYAEPKKLLEKVNPERLKEILRKLVSNYEERKDLELIPSFWDPHSFFQYEKLQNLWKNT